MVTHLNYYCKPYNDDLPNLHITTVQLVVTVHLVHFCFPIYFKVQAEPNSELWEEQKEEILECYSPQKENC